jgi:DNA-binding cell septation regulator SpoVG
MKMKNYEAWTLDAEGQIHQLSVVEGEDEVEARVVAQVEAMEKGLDYFK